MANGGTYWSRLYYLAFAAMLLLVTLVWGIGSPAASAATTTLNPADDSYVYQSNAMTNYGSNTMMYVKKSSGSDRLAYLKFNVSGVSAVSSAKLRVYVKSSANTTLTASQTSDNWTEGAITWNNKPAPGSVIGSASVTTTAKYVEIDVTSYVQAQANGDDLASFVLSESAGKYTEINSSENSANKPELVIIDSGGGGGSGDAQAPSAPASLTASAVSSSQINLSWSASTDNIGVTGYDVYRGGSFLKTVTGTTASDTGLTANTTYSYYVKAKDAAGNISASSNTKSATTLSGGTANCSGALNTASAIQNAMKNASPGTVILLAPGTYTGDRTTSGDPRLDSKGVPVGLFFSEKNGTSSNHIILKSCDPANPAVLKGTAVNDGSYGIHITGDYWEIRDVKVHTAQKGIMIDNGNYNLIYKAEVYNIGDEGVHFRDGSSYGTLDSSNIHDTGKYQPGYGEGAYVGSDESSDYEHLVYGNVIKNTVFGPGITAEHIDIKEGAHGTIVENCTFNGTGISGSNSADSFIDVKGVNSIIRYNTAYRNGNAKIVDAFQVRTHGSSYPTGKNNTFLNNTVYLDNSAGYVVYATSQSTGTTASGDTRSPAGNMYNSNVNK
jgi:hypothetical protein